MCLAKARIADWNCSSVNSPPLISQSVWAEPASPLK